MLLTNRYYFVICIEAMRLDCYILAADNSLQVAIAPSAEGKDAVVIEWAASSATGNGFRHSVQRRDARVGAVLVRQDL